MCVDKVDLAIPSHELTGKLLVLAQVPLCSSSDFSLSAQMAICQSGFEPC